MIKISNLSLKEKDIQIKLPLFFILKKSQMPKQKIWDTKLRMDKKQRGDVFNNLVIKNSTIKRNTFCCFAKSLLTSDAQEKKKKTPFSFLHYIGSNNKKEKFWNICFDKGRLKMFIFWFFQNYGQKKTLEFLEKLKEVGFHSATQAGISLGIDDLLISPEKSMLIGVASTGCQETIDQYKKAEITGVERFQRLIDTWHRTSEKFKEEVIDYFERIDLLNPVYMMAFSGARGNISQVRQLVGMRGLMSNPQGQILDYPIRSNFREGLTLTEYIISSYGARKGIVDTALRTANAGYLTRRLVDVAQHVMVSHFDCGTNRGIFVSEMKETGWQGTKTLYSLQNRLTGRVLAANVENSDLTIGLRNQEISGDLAFEISKIHQRVFIRSPLTCEGKKLVCQLCYGWSLAEAKLVSIGEAVGILAAQSIGEPGTQLTMRTFHTGGVFSGDFTEQVTAPFSGTIEYKEGIAGTLIRTPEGKIAFLTKTEGNFVLNKLKTLEVQEEKSNSHFVKIPAFTILYVRNQEKVSENQILAQISSFSRQKKQRDDAEQKIHSEIEGEIYSSHIDLISKMNDFQDNLVESSDWGSVWILSGKIYQSPVKSSFFSKSGDFVSPNCILNEIQWISPSTCEVLIESKKKSTQQPIFLSFFSSSFFPLEEKKQKACHFFSLKRKKKEEENRENEKKKENRSERQLVLNQEKGFLKTSPKFSFFEKTPSVQKNGIHGKVKITEKSKNLFEKFKLENSKEKIQFSVRQRNSNEANFSNKKIGIDPISKSFFMLKKEQGIIYKKKKENVKKVFDTFCFKKSVLSFNIKKIDYQKLGYVFSFDPLASAKGRGSNKQDFQKKLFSLICLNNKNEFFKSASILNSPSNWSTKSNLFIKCFSNKYQTNSGGLFYFNGIKNAENLDIFNFFSFFPENKIKKQEKKTKRKKSQKFSFFDQKKEKKKIEEFLGPKHLNVSFFYQKLSINTKKRNSYFSFSLKEKTKANKKKERNDQKNKLKYFSYHLLSSVPCQSSIIKHILWVPHEIYKLNCYLSKNSKSKEIYGKNDLKKFKCFNDPSFEKRKMDVNKESKLAQWFKKTKSQEISFYTKKKNFDIKRLLFQKSDSSMCLKYSKSHSIYSLSSKFPLFFKLNRQGIKTPLLSRFKGCLILNINRTLNTKQWTRGNLTQLEQVSFSQNQQKQKEKRKGLSKPLGFRERISKNFLYLDSNKDFNTLQKKLLIVLKKTLGQYYFLQIKKDSDNQRLIENPQYCKNFFSNQFDFFKFHIDLKEDLSNVKERKDFNNFNHITAYPSSQSEYLNTFKVSKFLNQKKFLSFFQNFPFFHSGGTNLKKKEKTSVEKFESILKVKNGWLYFPKQVTKAIQCHKMLVPPGKKFSDDLIFDKHNVFVECISLDNSFSSYFSFKEEKKENKKRKVFNLLNLRSFKYISNRKSRYYPLNFLLKNSSSFSFWSRLRAEANFNSKSFFLFIQKADDYFIRNLNYEKKEFNEFSKKNRDKKFSYLLFKNNYSILFNKQIISKNLDSLSPDFHIKPCSFFNTKQDKEPLKKKNLIKSNISYQRRKKLIKKIVAKSKKSNTRLRKKKFLSFKIFSPSKSLNTKISNRSIPETNSSSSGRSSFFLNKKQLSGKIIKRYPFCFFSFKKMNFFPFYLSFYNNDLFYKQKNPFDSSVLEFSTPFLNFHSNIDTKEIFFPSFFFSKEKRNGKGSFNSCNFFNLSAIFSSLLLRSVLDKKIEKKLNKEKDKSQKITKDKYLKDNKKSNMLFFSMKSLNYLSQYFHLPCFEFSFKELGKSYVNRFEKTTEFSLRKKENKKVKNSFFSFQTSGISEFFPISKYKLLINDEHKIRANTHFARTSFYSPYKGEITTHKKVFEGLKKNSRLILTSADFISFYKNQENINTIQNLDKKNLLLNEKEERVENVFISYEKKNYKVNSMPLGFPKQRVFSSLGEFFVYGDLLEEDSGIPQSGQIVHYNDKKITIRKGQPLFVSPKAILHTSHGDFVNVGSTVLTLPYQRLKTGDIVQGIPKVEQFFEARTTKGGRFFRENLPNLLKGLFSRYQLKLPLNQAVRQSFYKIQQILVDGVQRVYRSQGVNISDKHIEIIVRQMTSKVKIVSGGQTGFFPGELVDLDFLENVNVFLLRKIRYEPVLLGITKASLEVESFLSSASFQQTTKMLSRAAIYKRKDFLKGLKENVIVGNLIPVGTGYVSRND